MARHACPDCAAALAPDQRYCVNCGRPVASTLTDIRAALAGRPAPAPRPTAASARAARMAGAFSAMMAAGLGVGVLAGALIEPPSPVSAAQLIAVRVPAPSGAAAASASGAPAPSSTQVQAPAPAAPAAAPAAAAPAAATPGTSTPAATTTSPSTTTTTTSSTTTTTTTTTTTPTPTPVKLPAIRHVWLIMLADQSYTSLYGPNSAASYLTNTLVHEGTLLPDHWATAHGSLADGVALISGQGPTPQLQADCPLYGKVTPGTVSAATGLARGHGCVFPSTVATLPGQLARHSFTWRAYVAGQASPGDPHSACLHPQLGAADAPAATAIQTPTGGYVTRRNPFVYFRTLTAQPGCSRRDVGLGQLGVDLANGKVPNFSYVVPDLCTAGADSACSPAPPTTAGSTTTQSTTTPGSTITPTTPTSTTTPASTATPSPGTAAVGAFLATWIPKIQATSAYKRNGMIVVVSDQGPASGPNADSSACCTPIHYANSTNPGGTAQPGPGGGAPGR